MSSTTQIVLLLLWSIVLVLVPGTRSRPATEDQEVEPTRPILQDGLPADQTAAVGSDVTFECKVLSEPSPHIQWLKHLTINGSAYGPDGLPYSRVLKSSSRDADMEVLTLRNVTLDDAGEYTCLAGNLIGIAYRSAELTVVNRPSEVEPTRPILQDGLPADQTAAVGSDVTFECKVLSEPSPHIQWLKHLTINGSAYGPDGLPYSRVLKSSSRDADMEVLTLRNVTLDDAGEYTCLAGNLIGITYRSAKLTVVSRPSEVEPTRPILQDGLPADQTAAVGSDVTFECKVLSEPSPHIQWLKLLTINGSAYGPDGLPYSRVLKSSSRDADMEVLTLRNVTLDDAGEYTCLAGNLIGIAYRSAKLTVVSRPSGNIPQTLKIQGRVTHT